jgi:transaldolase
MMVVFFLNFKPTSTVQYKTNTRYGTTTGLWILVHSLPHIIKINRMKLPTAALFIGIMTSSFKASAFTVVSTSMNTRTTKTALQASQLEQLSQMTTLSIDSGDLKVIEQYAKTGFITDATTNPLFVSQAGSSGDPVYQKLVDDAVAFALASNEKDENSIVALAIDGLAVNLGASIASIVKGYISTEVNPKLAFDADASISRGRRIIAMYEEKGISKDRILIKLPATWEGILAAQVLEKEGIQCNLTLVFSFVQAVACAQRGAHLISPFTGRVLDWHKAKDGRTEPTQPKDDEGVVLCTKIYNYYKKYQHDTICMPASWRPSRGPGFDIDEIQALAGTDRMTIPAPLLEKLEATSEVLPRSLDPEIAKTSCDDEEVGNGMMDEKEFRYLLNMDGCGNDKLAEGLRAFIAETDKLEKVILDKVRAGSGV